jgi:hypothetical protein
MEVGSGLKVWWTGAQPFIFRFPNRREINLWNVS